jgi:hypothetical protein
MLCFEVKTSTISLDCTPTWKPKLPPVRLTNIGLLHVPLSLRIVSTPLPRRPPMPRPTLITVGTTATAYARSSSQVGIFCSGMLISSLSTVVEVCRRASCRSPATEAVAIVQENSKTATRVARKLPAKIRVSIVAVTPTVFLAVRL